jgi:hypothetical protein
MQTQRKTFLNLPIRVLVDAVGGGETHSAAELRAVAHVVEGKHFSNEFLMDAVAETPKKVLRQIRETLVELFVAIARVLFFWLPGDDVAKGRALMACHPIFIAAVIALFFIAAPRSPLRFLIAAAAILVAASQWLLGGCVVTRAEQRMTGGKETIMDPFLILAGVDVNRDTRNALTIGVSTTVCVTMLWVLFCDLLV